MGDLGDLGDLDLDLERLDDLSDLEDLENLGEPSNKESAESKAEAAAIRELGEDPSEHERRRCSPIDLDFKMIGLMEAKKVSALVDERCVTRKHCALRWSIFPGYRS